MKTLIAYYSRNGQNYFGGQLKYIEIGNTEKVAKMINEVVDSDLFKIEQVVPYSSEYKTCIAQAKDDKENNRHPELKNKLDNIDDYDAIYLGYPNYWGTMPMAVFTFLESYDFSNKTIYPFCTHEGSGFGSSLSDLRKYCPNIGRGIEIVGSKVDEKKDEIINWLKEAR